MRLHSEPRSAGAVFLAHNEDLIGCDENLASDQDKSDAKTSTTMAKKSTTFANARLH
jgi:hypothetical protein